MLKVTFYSYKGGVGRTLALLNVAVLLAKTGFKVVAVDMDLEAPGFGFSKLTRPSLPPKAKNKIQLGISDWVFDRRAHIDRYTVREYCYPILEDEVEDKLTLVPAGTRSAELAEKILSFYPKGYTEDPEPSIFQIFLSEIESDLKPDFILFDSRTGLADVAGVCTIDLPDVLVMLSGLQEQSIAGSEWVLRDLIQKHQEEDLSILKLLVQSPFPQDEDLKRVRNLKTLKEAYDELLERRKGQKDLQDQSKWTSFLEQEKLEHPLLRQYIQAQIKLHIPIYDDFMNTKQAFPRVKEEHLFHKVYFDPFVPIEGEYLVTQNNTKLTENYHAIAYALYSALKEKPSIPFDPPTQQDPLKRWYSPISNQRQ